MLDRHLRRVLEETEALLKEGELRRIEYLVVELVKRKLQEVVRLEAGLIFEDGPLERSWQLVVFEIRKRPKAKVQRVKDKDEVDEGLVSQFGRREVAIEILEGGVGDALGNPRFHLAFEGVAIDLDMPSQSSNFSGSQLYELATIHS